MTINIPAYLTENQLHGHACVKCGRAFNDDSPSQLPVGEADGWQLFACEPCVPEAERPSNLPRPITATEIQTGDIVQSNGGDRWEALSPTLLQHTATGEEPGEEFPAAFVEEKWGPLFLIERTGPGPIPARSLSCQGLAYLDPTNPIHQGTVRVTGFVEEMARRGEGHVYGCELIGHIPDDKPAATEVRTAYAIRYTDGTKPGTGEPDTITTRWIEGPVAAEDAAASMREAGRENVRIVTRTITTITTDWAEPDAPGVDSELLPALNSAPGVGARSGQVLLYAPCCCGLTHEQPLTPGQARALASTLANHADHIAPA